MAQLQHSAHPSIGTGSAPPLALDIFSSVQILDSIPTSPLGTSPHISPGPSALSNMRFPCYSTRAFSLSAASTSASRLPPTDTISKSCSAIINVQWNKSCALCLWFDGCSEWGSHQVDVLRKVEVGLGQVFFFSFVISFFFFNLGSLEKHPDTI